MAYFGMVPFRLSGLAGYEDYLHREVSDQGRDDRNYNLRLSGLLPIALGRWLMRLRIRARSVLSLLAAFGVIKG